MGVRISARESHNIVSTWVNRRGAVLAGVLRDKCSEPRYNNNNNYTTSLTLPGHGENPFIFALKREWIQGTRLLTIRGVLFASHAWRGQPPSPKTDAGGGRILEVIQTNLNANWNWPAAGMRRFGAP